ncbi:MAG TPA: hypothetical protein VFY58_01145, partial [Nocardioides sp.]|nr:hypothetical protein [Nocardioides sp.]
GNNMKRILASTAGLLMAGTASVMAAPPASAQPVITGGLVNVTVADNEILNDVNVGVALGVAAALCDVNVNVLAQQLRNAAPTCESDAGPVEIVQA